MKLKFYSEQTLAKKTERSGLPKINFGKSGAITLNKLAAKLVDLNDGDRITIAQDEEDACNFYIFKDQKNGFAIRSKKIGGKDTRGLQFNHKGLQIHVCKACDLDESNSNNFIVAGTPTVINGDKTKYWGLLVCARP